MSKIIFKKIIEPSNTKRVQDDVILSQTFTCCGKSFEKFLWEGWDWVDGNIIPEEIAKEFKYCPFCGEQITYQHEEGE